MFHNKNAFTCKTLFQNWLSPKQYAAARMLEVTGVTNLQ